MINQRLTNYIQRALNAGYDDNSIKNGLVTKGYSEIDVNDTIKYVKSQSLNLQGGTRRVNISESNESWIKKHWILTASLIIIIIAVISGLLTFKYSSPSGSHKGPLAESTDTKQMLCPQLSNLALEGYNELTNTWILDRADYKTSTEEIIYVEPPSDKEDGTKIFFCDLGRNEGQNPAYVYCGDFIRPIVLYKLDSSGNRISNSKTSVEILFDSKTKNYVTTKCGTYELANAP